MFARLGLDGSGFVRGLASAKSAAGKFSGDLVGSWSKDIGSKLKSSFGFAAIVGSIGELGRRTIDYADNVGDLSDQLDIATDDVQRLMIAGSRNGIEFETIAKAITHIGDARQKALGGDNKAQQLFARYGVSLKQLADGSMSNVDLLKTLYDTASAAGIGVQEQADLFDLAGKKGARLVATFQALKNLGPVKLLDEQNIKDLSAAKDAFGDLGRQLMTTAAPVAGFWARVLGRANGQGNIGTENIPMLGGLISAGRATQNFPKWIFDELLSGSQNPGPTAALTPEEIATRRKQLGGKVLPATSGKLANGGNQIDTGDSYSKIGLFVGGAGNPMVDISRRHLSVAEHTLAEIRLLRAAGSRVRP